MKAVTQQLLSRNLQGEFVDTRPSAVTSTHFISMRKVTRSKAMTDQLQQRLRDIREWSIFFSANQACLRSSTTVGEHKRGDAAWHTPERRIATANNTETVDREIAAIEKMLQQWLAERPAATNEPRRSDL